jgi:ribosomal protein S18 acetylase RimI-like enzyme
VPEPIRVVATTVWCLELAELRPAAAARLARVERAEVPFGPLNRLFYTEVGKDFDWIDKEGWSDERWQAWAEEVETWIVSERGTPAGFAELHPYPGGVELQTFGLLAPFRGRGLGGALLTRAAERARELAGRGGRVTVSTCDLDGPHALGNYRARGFVVTREEVHRRPSRRSS